MKAISFALVLAGAVALVPGSAAAHHGKKEEHAQPASARGCTWTAGSKKYASLAACMKGGGDKRSCRSACK